MVWIIPTGANRMFTSLRLERFKSFKDAELKLGPFTVLIGANASGKSNIRDAFRFLHGIGRGYSLAEILGEKYLGGERVWSGIRGGTREVAYSGSDSFALEVNWEPMPQKPRSPATSGKCFPAKYRIEVSGARMVKNGPRVAHESVDFQDYLGIHSGRRVNAKNVEAVFQRGGVAAGDP